MYAREISSSLFMLALAAAFWIGADAIRVSPLEGQVGAAGFPKLLAITLGALALVRIAQTLLMARRAGEGGSPAVGADGSGGLRAAWREHRRDVGMLGIGVVYVALLPVLGYPLSIALLFAGVTIYSGRRPTLGVAVVAIVGTAVLYGVFVWLLKVRMPIGIWGTLGTG